MVTGGLLACSAAGTGDEPQPGGLGGRGGGAGGAAAAGAGGFIVEPGGGSGGCLGSACGGAGGSAGTSGGDGPLCGNDQLDEGEQCDDGNAQPGDGCTGACNLEPNFVCDEVGEPCMSTVECGDGAVGGLEACDDGNLEVDDGCSASCLVEIGFGCSTGSGGASVCLPDARVECGDSVVGAGEQCDDGNAAPGDGCSAACQVEAEHVCPIVGQPCLSIAYCGDGFLRDGEQCDDGNNLPGDGCDGACNVLPNFVCPEPGKPCRSTVVCGDLQITGSETCDDGNDASGDGCSSLCRAEAGYDCTGGGAIAAPGACVPVPEERCGDSRLAATEYCDDGNTAAGDGCSATCTVEAGFDCPDGPGSLCVRIGFCGDGAVNVTGEQCDDRNPQSGDGCTAGCLREALFTCPALGGPCTSNVVCGDMLVNGAETCDDGNTTGGDGCNASCRAEAGFVCPVGGVCRAVCGDGLRAGREQCDDGDTSAGDGCGPDCRLEQGFACSSAGGGADTCVRTSCGRNGREGTEQCDDGNPFPYDGCDDLCRNEPSCGSDARGDYVCGAVCGDGMKFPEEGCDDGNTLSGDGCSASCRLEPGYACEHHAVELGEALDLPVIFRDMSERHPQFEIRPHTSAAYNGRLPNIVASRLGSDGKPVYNPGFSAVVPTCGGASRPYTMDGPSGATSSNLGGHDDGVSACNSPTLSAAQRAERFQDWYHDTGNNVPILGFLQLRRLPDLPPTFQYARTGSDQFFLLDGKGYGNQGQSRNYHFTSEVRQWFEYQGLEKLSFSGDDDVWVFINGQLTVDLGGIHGELFGSIELPAKEAYLDGARSTLCVGSSCAPFDVELDPYGVNEIAVFQAERHVIASNYTLTLRGFDAPLTSCQSICGDGVVTPDETCDLGPGRNTGSYGGCNENCTLPARCGDGVQQSAQGEQCDNGVNTSARFVAAGDCAPGCVLPARCGDGRIDGAFEACDDGAANVAPGTYGACDTSCQLGPRCGDGVKQAAKEACDDGPSNGTSGSACLADCHLRCGNGLLDPGEQCDEGGANAAPGTYGACGTDCRLGPRCGDAVVDAAAGEACDDGLNDGSYGTCSASCQAGPYCGDGAVQQSELCDSGSANSSSAYGPDLCTTQCRPAPRCGDRAVNTNHGEVCDDGVNDGRPGSCASDCKSAIPLPSCGNGAVETGEQCDHGAANGARGDSCDVRCQNTCGNGFVNPGEQCDDGVNDGSYGTCRADCTFAGFCGDGAVSGPEACDQGSSNVPPANAYGSGVCTTTCANAPRCGDGRVDTREACDGGPFCTSACNILR